MISRTVLNQSLSDMSIEFSLNQFFCSEVMYIIEDAIDLRKVRYMLDKFVSEHLFDKTIEVYFGTGKADSV